MAARTIIKVNNLVKIFGERVVLYDISLDIQEQEIFGVIGSSGAGKTTLLSTLIGFLKPEKGEVLVRGELVQGGEHEQYSKVTADKVKSVIGFASQHPSVYPELTAEENLKYFARLHKVSKEDAEHNIDLLLGLMDLENARHTLCANMSGGMQRRLDIACALIHHPKILILDEPTADLDPYLRRHIWNLVRRINSQGTTIIVSSHHLQDLEEICSRVAIVSKGKLVDVDSPANIKHKYLKTQEIHIQTRPGRYKQIADSLTDSNISAFETVGGELVIYTEEPQKVIKKILIVLQRLSETLEDIKIVKSSLDDVFVRLAGSQ